MCGLAALISWGSFGVTGQEYKAFQELLHISAIRGSDSTGIIYVGENKDDGIQHGWLKSLGVANDLFTGETFQKHAKAVQASNVILGHCRYATRGDIKVDHSHPFEHKHITMIHNGTLRDIGCFPAFKKFDVDSEALCHALAEYPTEEVLKSLDGAAAIMWWDDKKKTVNVWRNWDRPLHCIKLRDGGTVFMASEERMLQWILERNNIGTFGNIFSLPTETLVTWDWNENTPRVEDIRRDYNYGKKQEAANDKNIIINLPTPKKQEDEPKKNLSNLVPVKGVFGLSVGDTILFEPTNIEYNKGDASITTLEGMIASVENKKTVSIGMLENVMVKVFLRNKTKVEVETLFKSPYLNSKDISDVKCYVDNKTVEPFLDTAAIEALDKTVIDRH
jgi:hypothetical protein